MTAQHPTAAPSLPVAPDRPRDFGPAALAAVLWVVAGVGVGLAVSVVGVVTVPLAAVLVVTLVTAGARWAAVALTGAGALVAAVVGVVTGTSSLATCSQTTDGTSCSTVPDRGPVVLAHLAPAAALAVACTVCVVVAVLAERRAHSGRAPRTTRTAVLRLAPLAAVGAGLVPCWVAWLDRAGPGTVCRAIADGGQACEEQLSPWPWLVVGLALCAAGVGLLVALRRRPGATTTA